MENTGASGEVSRDDVLAEAENYFKALKDSAPSTRQDEGFWQSYFKRLSTYDPLEIYPPAISPIKCAMNGWTYLGRGLVRCEDCRRRMLIQIGSTSDISITTYTIMIKKILAGLKNEHDHLCSWRSGQDRTYPSYNVQSLMTQLEASGINTAYQSNEISNELQLFDAHSKFKRSLPLYFAIAGWSVKDKSLKCERCLREFIPEKLIEFMPNRVMDPLLQHYYYCPVVAAPAPLWKSALLEFCELNNDNDGIRDVLFLVQKRLSPPESDEFVNMIMNVSSQNSQSVESSPAVAVDTSMHETEMNASQKSMDSTVTAEEFSTPMKAPPASRKRFIPYESEIPSDLRGVTTQSSLESPSYSFLLPKRMRLSLGKTAEEAKAQKPVMAEMGCQTEPSDGEGKPAEAVVEEPVVDEEEKMEEEERQNEEEMEANLKETVELDTSMVSFPESSTAQNSKRMDDTITLDSTAESDNLNARVYGDEYDDQMNNEELYNDYSESNDYANDEMNLGFNDDAEASSSVDVEEAADDRVVPQQAEAADESPSTPRGPDDDWESPKSPPERQVPDLDADEDDEEAEESAVEMVGGDAEESETRDGEEMVADQQLEPAADEEDNSSEQQQDEEEEEENDDADDDEDDSQEIERPADDEDDYNDEGESEEGGEELDDEDEGDEEEEEDYHSADDQAPPRGAGAARPPANQDQDSDSDSDIICLD